jgi:hypothetical protein
VRCFQEGRGATSTGCGRLPAIPTVSFCGKRASLDFREEEHSARLATLLKSLETEILSVLEATNQLRESPEFELYELTTKNPEMFD